ncbi:hypothetical protein QWY84_06315 [Aquisalimonas lutea]|uniref:hypothetical protein n=1 Tax=Aquisalimonas lutea TaxID=1327750 RepID=UPI0025B2FD63|nr:hypothetical protein [Aquisalimonas lutea]MDN3517214.1 hypothetical protein [Aquisalimonas lutea]
MPDSVRFRIAALVIIGLIPLFFVDLGTWRRAFAPELHTFAHVGFFALLAWLAMQAPPLQSYRFPVRGGLVVLAALALGGTIELIQPWFGRSAGLQDLWQDLLGAMAAVALNAPTVATRRALGAVMAVILVAELYAPAISLWDRGVARIQFPVLSDFSTTFEHRRWSAGEPDDTVARIGERSLRVDLKPGRFSGTTLRRSLGDWSHYDTLELSIYNPAAPLSITISIRDHDNAKRGGEYSDRFNRRFLLRPGWNDLAIAVDDVRNAPAQRQQHLDDLAMLAIFTANLDEHRTLYLDRVRLSE